MRNDAADETANQTAANRIWVERLQVLWAGLLQEVLVRGYHGSAGLEVTVQDGTIQGVRRNTERKER